MLRAVKSWLGYRKFKRLVLQHDVGAIVSDRNISRQLYALLVRYGLDDCVYVAARHGTLGEIAHVVVDTHGQIPAQQDDDDTDFKQLTDLLTNTDAREAILNQHPIFKELVHATCNTSIDNSPETSDLSHDDVAKRVVRRLFLRHAQIHILKKLTDLHVAGGDSTEVERSTSEQHQVVAPRAGGAQPADASSAGASKVPRSGPQFIAERLRDTRAALVETVASNKQNEHAVKLLKLDTDPEMDYTLYSEDLRSYKLAVTDIFVEKALTYLEINASKYTAEGKRAFAIGRWTVMVGVLISLIQFSYVLWDDHEEKKQRADIVSEIVRFGVDRTIERDQDIISTSEQSASIRSQNENDNGRQRATAHVDSLIGRLRGAIASRLQHEDGTSWTSFLRSFTTGFTFYGMLVLLAVGSWRYGRAMMDQAERLYEKRHALREGRLFVHLRDGNVTIESMEKAFNWNVTQPNAFSNMHTEAKAPWGAAFSDLLKLPDTLKKFFKRYDVKGDL